MLITVIFTVSKYEEIFPPSLQQIQLISETSFNHSDIINLE